MNNIALDVHAHLIPAEFVADAPGVTWNMQAETLSLDNHVIGLSQLFRPDDLVDWMDKNGVEQAWISIPPLVYRQHLSEAASEDWTERLNEGLSEIAAGRGQRLRPLHHLPVEHPALAVRQARQRKTTRYAMCAGGETDVCYSDARLNPLWAALDEQKAFVFLHPGRCCDTRLKPYYLENLLGNPHETAVTVAHLVFGGVLERFSAIQFCLAHGGGTVPALAGRWQHGFDNRQPGVNLQALSPKSLLGRFHIDGLMHSSAALTCAADVFGMSRVIFGSDWPFAMGIGDVESYLGMLPQMLRTHICQERTWNTDE